MDDVWYSQDLYVRNYPSAASIPDQRETLLTRKITLDGDRQRDDVVAIVRVSRSMNNPAARPRGIGPRLKYPQDRYDLVVMQTKDGKAVKRYVWEDFSQTCKGMRKSDGNKATLGLQDKTRDGVTDLVVDRFMEGCRFVLSGKEMKKELERAPRVLKELDMGGSRPPKRRPRPESPTLYRLPPGTCLVATQASR